MNNLILNAHAVPLVDLLTLNIVFIIAIVYLARQYGKCDNQSCMLLAGALLAASIVFHPMVGIPDNLSYYFGLGERPVGWRGVR